MILDQESCQGIFQQTGKILERKSKNEFGKDLIKAASNWHYIIRA